MTFMDIRATRLPADDVDFLRSFARAGGFNNTSVAVVRFAVRELAARVRQTTDIDTDGNPLDGGEPSTQIGGLRQADSSKQTPSRDSEPAHS